MGYSRDQLRQIYDRTSGKCHICHKKLAFKNYGVIDARAPWEVEHSVPRSKGGTGHLNNLFAACISCNREKSNGTTRSARARNGVTRAPLSTANRIKAKKNNALVGGLCGFALGIAGGPIVALFTTAVGAGLAYDKDPDKL